MRFEESLAALAADLTGAAAHATGGVHTLTLEAGRFQADAVASEALLAGEAAGAPVLGVSVPAEPARWVTVTF